MPSPDPYRVLFPLGAVLAMSGAALWPLHTLGVIAYPGPLHWTLMIQGFQHCFVLGFLLTALPSFLHAPRCTAVELGLAVAAMVTFAAASVAGYAAPAQGAYIATLLLLPAVAVRRLRAGASAPPEEFLMVAVGLVFGLLGAAVSMGAASGWWTEPSPRFGLRLVSLGMVLSLVLGIGGLLVPTFSAMREPLVIPGLARPHDRRPRRLLYVVISAALALALLLEGRGASHAGAVVRAGAGSAVLLWVWKLHRRPGSRDAVAWTIWAAGWLLFLGILVAALIPARPLLGFHLMFMGGMGLLTLGIATRVTVRHGGYRLTAEGRVLQPWLHAVVALALAARMLAELDPGRRPLLLAVSGVAWSLGWAAWLARALPYFVRVAPPAIALGRAPSPQP